jgi:hypothetical protein
LFDYEHPNSEPIQISAKRINPYLVDAPDLLLPNRNLPISPVPKIGIGNKPIDGGNYLFSDEEKAAFIAKEPLSEKWFRRWLGANEFLNSLNRWCLLLRNCPPEELRQMPEARKRVEAVKAFRLASKSAPTVALASKPRRFHVEFNPVETFLLIPRHSSEKRPYIPLGFFGAEVLSGDANLVMQNAKLYNFGILSSVMHMAWTRTVCGRIKSDYRYSAGIVYNNFPYPTENESKRINIEKAAKNVLDTRANYPLSSLADLYDPITMPDDLAEAHQKLDKSIDDAYGYKGDKSDAARVAFLFDRYAKLINSQSHENASC